MLTSIWHIVMERASHICDVLCQIHRLSLIMKIFSSVQSLSHVMPLWPHGLQPARFLLHQHLELVQTHVHQVSDAIRPSHPLSSPSLPAFNLSHHQGLFQWVSSSHQVAKLLDLQLQHQPFPWIFRTDFL